MSVLAAAAEAGVHAGLLATTFGLGLRHGVDWDHIAAITDITASQEGPRRAIFLASAYALGHAAVVLVLGIAAVLAGAYIPASVDAAMGRVVGGTLVVLGVYLLVALARNGSAVRLRSRWMLLIDAMQAAWRWARPREAVVVHDHEHPVGEHHTHAELAVAAAATVTVPVGDDDREPVGARAGRHVVHRHPHRHVGAEPDDLFAGGGVRSATTIGLLHGIGAETPTQVLLFVTAAGVSGRGSGLVLLTVFLAGLVCSNTLLAVATSYGFRGLSARRRLYVALTLLAAVGSLAVGAMLLGGRDSALPAIFG